MFPEYEDAYSYRPLTAAEVKFMSNEELLELAQMSVVNGTDVLEDEVLAVIELARRVEAMLKRCIRECRRSRRPRRRC